MLRKVKLYGDLAKFVGERVLEADVANAAQSIRFLLANWPELEKYMADKNNPMDLEEWANHNGWVDALKWVLGEL